MNNVMWTSAALRASAVRSPVRIQVRRGMLKAQSACAAAAHGAALQCLPHKTRRMGKRPGTRATDEQAASVIVIKMAAETEAARLTSLVEAKQADTQTADATRLQGMADVKAGDDAAHWQLRLKGAAEASAPAAETTVTVTSIGTGALGAAARLLHRLLAQLKQPRTWLALSVFGGLVFLGIDWLTHDCETYLMWCMKEALRNGRLVPPPTEELHCIPTEDYPRLYDAGGPSRPVLLYGPTGSGKSTYVHKVAWDNVRVSDPARGTTILPTALVRFVPDVTANTSRSDKNAVMKDTEFESSDDVATHVCTQLQFPIRRSWLSLLTAPPQSCFARARMSQASQAIYTLFKAAHALCLETKQRPVLIFDEAHDLVRHRTVSMAGGDAVFKLLGTSAVSYGIERKSVDFVAVGSSALFIFHWADVTPLSSARRLVLEMPDLSRSEAYSALVTPLNGVEYSPEEANQLLDACGQRVRLLQPALTRRASAALIVADVQGNASEAIEQLFDDVAPEVRPKLVALLDDIARADKMTAERPKKRHAPFPLTATNNAAAALRVLHVDRHRHLHFQSDAVRQAWTRDRLKYAPVTAPPPASTIAAAWRYFAGSAKDK